MLPRFVSKTTDSGAGILCRMCRRGKKVRHVASRVASRGQTRNAASESRQLHNNSESHRSVYSWGLYHIDKAHRQLEQNTFLFRSQVPEVTIPGMA